jgi:hypothetical protein
VLRNIRVDLIIPDQQLVFFWTFYGQPRDCPSGCYYSSALGIMLGNKVGWIETHDYDGAVFDEATYYNVESTDAALFQQSTWAQLEALDLWTFWDVFLPYLAVDEDSPREALARIAQRLYEWAGRTSLGGCLPTRESDSVPRCFSFWPVLGTCTQDPAQEHANCSGTRS